MNETKPTDQGLIPASKVVTGIVIETPQDYSRYLEQQRTAHAHILSPVTDLGALPPNWVLVPSAVKINPDESAGEVYKDGLFCRGDEVALTKVGLRKIATAAGIGWTVVREDSGHVQNYWAMKCTISFRGHDGMMKPREASYEWDLRDGSPRVAGMSAKELSRARLNGYRRCEAGAINAGIREYGLKQKYTKQELQRPFVVFNLVFKPETEEQKNMLAQAALTGTTMLYPGAIAALPPADPKVVDQLKPGAQAAEVPFEDEDEAADDFEYVTVTSVSQVPDTSDYFVIVNGGRKLHTADKGVAKICNDARKHGLQIGLLIEAGEITETRAPKTAAAGADKY